MESERDLLESPFQEYYITNYYGGTVRTKRCSGKNNTGIKFRLLVNDV